MTAKSATAKGEKRSAKSEAMQRASNCKRRGLQGPVFKDGDMYLSELDLAKMELAHMKVQNAEQAIRLKRAEQETLKRDAESRMMKLDHQMRDLINAGRAAQVRLTDLQLHVASCYRVDIKWMVYDDETGKITIHEPPEEEDEEEGDDEETSEESPEEFESPSEDGSTEA